MATNYRGKRQLIIMECFLTLLTSYNDIILHFSKGNLVVFSRWITIVYIET